MRISKIDVQSSVAISIGRDCHVGSVAPNIWQTKMVTTIEVWVLLPFWQPFPKAHPNGYNYWR
jgi:hypothetical protein